MKISTFTVVVGTRACNLRCPFCVSKMTPSPSGDTEEQPIPERSFDIGCRLAEKANTTTILLTGKGEPTLYPGQITVYTIQSAERGFPFVELQTNGLLFWEERQIFSRHLATWYENGMTTISLSIVHYDSRRNAQLLAGGDIAYPIWEIVRILHDIGFSVRINCTLCRGHIDNSKEIEILLDHCREHNVEQTTLRNVTLPNGSENEEVTSWVKEHQIPTWADLHPLRTWLNVEKGATEVLQLPHGAIVFDYKGQNLCLNNCLTESRDPERIRQLILFPDGHLRYSWQYPGAILL